MKGPFNLTVEGNGHWYVYKIMNDPTLYDFDLMEEEIKYDKDEGLIHPYLSSVLLTIISEARKQCSR